MKFLQTSDWHLGKTLHGYNLLEDQAFFLEQIIEELKNGYDALLVPGDLYDRPIPPAEAVSLLSNFIGRIHKLYPELEIFILSGNHDSSERLAFLKDILDELKIHISTNPSLSLKPFILDKKSEKCAVYQIPFLYPGSLQNEDGEYIKKQDELYKKLCDDILKEHNKNYSDCMSLICTHLMTVKSTVSDSERSFVGTAEEVDAVHFEGFDYTAVGHLHSFQKAGKKNNIFYSGSPLSYSFDDTNDKVMLSVTLSKISGKTEVNIEKIPIKPLHKVESIKGCYDDFYTDKELKKKYSNSFLELCLKDGILSEGAVSLLRAEYPYLLSIRKLEMEDSYLRQDFSERKKALESNDSSLIFEQFYSDVYGTNETEYFTDEKTLFLEMNKNCKE
ncbi:MAG: exonuclease subunit SbcD [Treponema sp.]|nr:exonuclease subunit SbcD [Treponema sp.]